MIKATQSDDTRSLTESTYRLIRSDILSGSIQPENKMQIIDLSQRHGTSASAVREALSRLVSESLVTLEVQKGFRAAPMSVREFQEITDLRIMLEMEAIRSAIMLAGKIGKRKSSPLTTVSSLPKRELQSRNSKLPSTGKPEIAIFTTRWSARAIHNG